MPSSIRPQTLAKGNTLMSISSRFVHTAGVLALCLASLSALAQQAQPSDIQAAEFPPLERSYLKTGDFIGPDHVRRITHGLTKDQVRLELGNPHFSEGLFGVKEWDYAFNFYTGKGSDYVTCQFKVRFDAAGGPYRVVSTYWKNPDCAALVQPSPVVSVPVTTKLPPTKKVTLNADGLFRFDGAALSDLLPEGRERLERLANELSNSFKSLHYVVVTGHTDKLGSDAYNETLSLERANTVRDLLVQQGIDRGLTRIAGMGKRQPVVSDCEGKRSSPALLRCLQPNRRVEIEIAGEQ